MSTSNTATNRPRKRTRRATRRTFGSVRQERSGHYAAHYTDPTTSQRVNAPTTFTSERAADDWLTTVRADIVRGVHRPAHLGTITLRDYFGHWLSQHTNLAQGTRDQYADHLRRWIDRELSGRPSGAGTASNRTVCLGDFQLNVLSPGLIREWFAAASYTQHLERAERAAVAAAKADRRHPARVWAQLVGIPCSDRGRLSPVILRAWHRAGRPEQGSTPLLVPADARPATVVRQAYRTLRACLNDAVRDGLMESNPCRIPGAGTGRPAERRPATVPEVEAIANAMPDRYAAAVIVAAWSGLRAGELFGLARRHVDSEAGTVRVERAMKTRNRAGMTPTLGPTKTDASRRTVHLPPHVAKLLDHHLERHTGAGQDALVFSRADGSLVPSWQRRAMFSKARQAAGRPDLRWHDLRHTGATLAAMTGASIREIQSRLGHTTYEAAMTYQHASAERDREVAARLDAYAEGLRNRTITPIRRQTNTERTALA